MTPAFIGPRQMTASSRPCRRNPTDITLSPPTRAGTMASSSTLSVSSRSRSIPGTLGPWMSMSRRPTRLPASPRATARFTATVLLPTPPFPDRTTTVCRISLRRRRSASSSVPPRRGGGEGASFAFRAAPRRPLRPTRSDNASASAAAARIAQCLDSSGRPPAAAATSSPPIVRSASSGVFPSASRAAALPLAMEWPQPSVVKEACAMRPSPIRSQISTVSPQGPVSRAWPSASRRGPKLAGSSLAFFMKSWRIQIPVPAPACMPAVLRRIPPRLFAVIAHPRSIGVPHFGHFRSKQGIPAR